MRSLLRLLPLVGLLVACELPFGVSADLSDVDISLVANGVRISNNSGTIVHYQAIGVNSIMDWVPCVRPDCPHVAVGATTVVPFAEIPAADSPVLEVYYWQRTDGVVADWEDVRKVAFQR